MLCKHVSGLFNGIYALGLKWIIKYYLGPSYNTNSYLSIGRFLVDNHLENVECTQKADNLLMAQNTTNNYKKISKNVVSEKNNTHFPVGVFYMKFFIVVIFLVSPLDYEPIVANEKYLWK